MTRVGYQTVYLWECECGTIWQLRRRPRAGKPIVCGPDGEQRLIDRQAGGTWRGCGTVSTSSGKREGIAPNL